MLIDNQNNEFLPTLSSFFNFSISLMNVSKRCDIYLTEYFHLQFIYLTAIVAIGINLIKSSSFYYGTEQHSKLWQMRGHLGSKPFTALISSDLLHSLHFLFLHEIIPVFILSLSHISMNGLISPELFFKIRFILPTIMLSFPFRLIQSYNFLLFQTKPKQ